MVRNYRPIGRGGQGEAVRETFQLQMDGLYKDRHFDLIRYVELPKGQVFATKLGKRCRRGYIIRDRETGECQGVGEYVLRLLHDHYHAVPLPPRFHRRDIYGRPKKTD